MRVMRQTWVSRVDRRGRCQVWVIMSERSWEYCQCVTVELVHSHGYWQWQCCSTRHCRGAAAGDDVMTVEKSEPGIDTPGSRVHPSGDVKGLASFIEAGATCGVPREERELRKRALIDSYPGLLTGPHGVSLQHADCLPLYVLSLQNKFPGGHRWNLVLLGAPPASDIPGLDRLRAALKMVIPFVPSDKIAIRKYDKMSPIAVWDDRSNSFAFALPKPCDEHTNEQCLCWIGPALQDAAKDYNLKGRDKISASKLFRGFLSCMGGDTIVKAVVRMDVESTATVKAPANTSPAKKQTQPIVAQPLVPPHQAPVHDDGSEAALNWAALAQISNAVLGYNALQGKHDALIGEVQILRAADITREQRVEEMRKASEEKDAKIAGLEEETKDLREDLAYYEEGAAARKAKREFKRQRTE
ncbi:hypothetical protein DFH09DRAFT_1089071 [Mycena vulgaris]|nr:hypothetical protein DFH09DRAFT_1089071 [Mycena vulgaris]